MYFWFVFSDGKLLVKRAADGKMELPLQEACPVGAEGESNEPFIFREIPCKVLRLAQCKSDENEDRFNTADYQLVPLRQCYELLDAASFQIAGKAAEWLNWDEETRFCGCCGAPTERQTNISKVCPHCHREIWPKLSPAVIVLIRRKDKVLLVQSRAFRRNYYGLVAGFVEMGEDLEQAIKREVREEVGLEISNLKYFGSQPWPYPRNLMIGFTAECESGEISLQYEELNRGGWFSRDKMPEIPGKASIARRLIDDWLELGE